MQALSAVLGRAARHCVETGTNPDEYVTARLYPDMAPFHFQIEALKNHAVWGVEAVRTGEFAPPPLVGEVPFVELQQTIAEAIRALEALDPEQVDSCSGKSLDIVVYRPVDEENASTSAWGPRTFRFTPETFLLSYSLPNFYFHAVTAYNILRTRGVPIGKGNYEGKLRGANA